MASNLSETSISLVPAATRRRFWQLEDVRHFGIDFWGECRHYFSQLGRSRSADFKFLFQQMVGLEGIFTWCPYDTWEGCTWYGFHVPCLFMFMFTPFCEKLPRCALCVCTTPARTSFSNEKFWTCGINVLHPYMQRKSMSRVVHICNFVWVPGTLAWVTTWIPQLASWQKSRNIWKVLPL